MGRRLVPSYAGGTCTLNGYSLPPTVSMWRLSPLVSSPGPLHGVVSPPPDLLPPEPPAEAPAAIPPAPPDVIPPLAAPPLVAPPVTAPPDPVVPPPLPP